MTRKLLCVLAAALAVPALALAFGNTEPFAAEQWYLDQDRAWSFWQEQPQLRPVKVAVIDSGIDFGHPEFAGRILGGRSFVGGTWRRDTDGHGTFVAGLIAADPGNGQGIAGLAFNAQLLIAKVVAPDDSGVNLAGEVKAIRWAVDAGAQVINLSLGGVRDPVDPSLDSFSPDERDAIAYAVAKGVVVIAAVGNGTESPSTPWIYADYPAALPHVLGVGALRQNGSVPAYSNRDPVFVDVAAPGDAIVSTVPRNLVDVTQPNCADTPYSTCGPSEFRDAIGTSFAAPQVAAAAALLLGADPSLTPDQVVWLLERSARDVNQSTGCGGCAAGRDALTGWGRLDVAGALALLRGGELPRPDPLEPNDDAGGAAPAVAPPRTIAASLDAWDDPVDVYAVRLVKGRRLYARLSASVRGAAALTLWRPGTAHVWGPELRVADRAASGASVGAQERLAFLAPASGRYFVAVKLSHARMRISYTLALATA
ncbi:MAG TPA: S8 family serine peptidase [Gaiellaceae bacterium]|nr:S8 family serine peptidase [Gaiellaceae bacterium]